MLDSTLVVCVVGITLLNYTSVSYIECIVVILLAALLDSNISWRWLKDLTREWTREPDYERTVVTIERECVSNLQQLVLYPNALSVQVLNNRLASLNGLQICTNLLVLKVSNNRLESLLGIEACINLRELHCNQNRLTSLQGIELCSNLEVLYCNKNLLTSVALVANCRALKRLDCSGNRLVNLNGIGNCRALEYLNVQHMGLATLTGIEGCTRLKQLQCGHNRLGSIRCVQSFPQLTHLNCCANRLTTLEGLNICSKLEDLICHRNQLTSIDVIVNLQQLLNITAHNNPLGVLPQSVRLVLRKLGQNHKAIDITHRPLRVPKPVQHIPDDFTIVYADSQNTHDASIKRTVCESLSSLSRDPKPKPLNLNSYPKIKTHTRAILQDHCSYDSVCYGFTYEILLRYVLQRINKSQHRIELFRVLEIQVTESANRCWTGRFNSLLSVLAGFYNDIHIGISDTERISIIILTSKSKVRPYDPYIHQRLAQRQLLDAGYNPHEIAPWIRAITEDY